jgi:bifunctional non-homologous end joining protein LigD
LRQPRPDADAVLVAGVRLTHPGRVLYPGQGVTKQALAEYLLAVADRMLPHLAGRPLALVRCPSGREGACFYQQHAGAGLPAALPRVSVPEAGGTAEHVAVTEPAHLVALAQVGALELHPWGSRADDLGHPDRLILDLDPGEGVAFADVAAAALEVRERLAAAGLAGFAKTTGGKGLHVTAPLAPGQGWDAAKAFAKGIADAMAADDPDRFTAKAAKAGREGRIYLDYLRNELGATAVAPYSPRARPGATVAAPLAWEEVTPALDPAALTVGTVPARPDPWAGFAGAAAPLPRL